MTENHDAGYTQAEVEHIRKTVHGHEPWWFYTYGWGVPPPHLCRIVAVHVAKNMGLAATTGIFKHPDNEKAIAYVHQRALEGSELHQRALAIHTMCRLLGDP
jgi:hypothetical protein